MTKATATPISGAKLYAIWNCPKRAGLEPAGLVLTGDHNAIYPTFLQLVGKNPEPDERTYVMQDAHAPAPLYAG